MKEHLSKEIPTLRFGVKLTKIRSIEQERCEKLRAAGVDSVERMANRSPY